VSTKILVVESDANILHLLAVKLRKAGYNVIMATNGTEAARLAQVEQPDAVISEVILPGMEGLALARRLKAQPQAAPVVIMLSVLGSDRDIAAGFAAGADDYMTKPFSPLVLVERVRVNLIRTGRISPDGAGESEATDG
jgi:DNA-binding response OmpR family regulator